MELGTLRDRRRDAHERDLQFAEQVPGVWEAGRETPSAHCREKNLEVRGFGAARSSGHRILTQEQNQLRMIKYVRVACDAVVRQREQEIYEVVHVLRRQPKTFAAAATTLGHKPDGPGVSVLAAATAATAATISARGDAYESAADQVEPTNGAIGDVWDASFAA